MYRTLDAEGTEKFFAAVEKATAIALSDRMTKQAAAEYLGVSVRTLERYKEIPRLRWKRRVWYSRAELARFITQREGVQP